jgi:predicted DNA-binding ribbon-helix-helix protein
VQSTRLINRNVVAERGRTSMRLEPELWDALKEICRRERQDINQLVRHIESLGYRGGRTSAVRVYVLQYFRAAACEAGHEAANHGPNDRLALAHYPQHAA